MTHSFQEEALGPGPTAAAPVLGSYQSGASLYRSSLLLLVPLVCFTGALLSDIAYVKDPETQWSNFSAWLLAFGMLFLGLAIIVNIIGFVATYRRRHRPPNWLSNLFVVAAAVTALFDNFIHSHDGWTSVWPTGLMLSAMATLFLFVGIMFKIRSLSNTYVVESK